MALAIGQVTIIDLNDSISLQGYLNGSQANGQAVDTTGVTFTPSWVAAPLVITATLSKMGSGDNIIASSDILSIAWTYILGNGPESPISSLGDALVSGSKGQILTISKNKMTLAAPSIKFIASIIYKHTTLGNFTYKTDITYTLQKQGGDGVNAITSFGSMPDGNVFYNTLGSNPSLRANIDIYDGNTLAAPSSFLWFYQDPLVTTTGSPGYHVKGGLGWNLVTNSAGLYSGVTTRELSFYANSVNGSEIFKCVATYKNVDYIQFYTVVDQTDPYQVVIDSTGGSKFKNSVGSTVLTARVIQAGIEIDQFGAIGSAFPIFSSYLWSKYDKLGNKDISFIPKPATMGLTIAGGTTTVIKCNANALASFGIGSKVIIGTETIRTVTNKDASSITIGAPIVAPGVGVAIKDASMKRIYISNEDIITKSTFSCDID